MDKIRSLAGYSRHKGTGPEEDRAPRGRLQVVFHGSHGYLRNRKRSCDVVNAVAEELESSGRTDIRLTTSGCIGACEFEPVMTVEALGAEPVLYGHLDGAKAREVFRRPLPGKSSSAYLVYVGQAPSDASKGHKGARA